MQSNTFKISADYIQKKVRGPLIGALVFSLAMVAILLLYASDKRLNATGFSLLAIAIVCIGSWVFLTNVRRSRAFATRLPSLSIELLDDRLVLMEPGERSEILIDTFSGLDIDRRSGEVRKLYLKRKSGPTIELEGLDRVDQFVSRFGKLIGSSRVRELHWWQGPLS